MFVAVEGFLCLFGCCCDRSGGGSGGSGGNGSYDCRFGGGVLSVHHCMFRCRIDIKRSLARRVGIGRRGHEVI